MKPAKQTLAPSIEQTKQAHDLPPNSRVQAIAPEQLRAARSLLDWTRTELAQKARISAETIKNIEHGTYSPKEETLKAIIEVFARYGVQFIRYETTIAVPDHCDPAGRMIAFSYAGAVRATAFVLEGMGVADD